MAREDFDIETLSAYLHLDRAQVKKMADRGKVPGRKAGGHWRFSRGDIHHWLEKRILGADEKERTRLEEVFAHHTEHWEDDAFTIGALIPEEAIAVPLHAKTRRSVISRMVEVATETGWLWDPERMEEAIRQREELLPTTVEGGVALLHPRRPVESILGRPFVVYGRTGRGIPFGDPSGGLTDLFFLICSTDDRGHLRTLALLGRVLSTPGILDELRETEGAVTSREILRAAQ